MSYSAPVWDDTPSRNILLPENLERVRGEFTDGNVVFGWHYYYAGGRSGDLRCFSGFDDYLQELMHSRPGDHFTIYSRRELLSRAVARVGEIGSMRRAVIGDFGAVKKALDEGMEIIYLWSRELPGGRLESYARILWDLTDDELHEWLDLDSRVGGEFLFFDMKTLDEDQEGVPVGGVSSGPRTRVNAVADGKRPNEAGLTPPSGPY